MKMRGLLISYQMNRLSFAVIVFLLLSLPLFATDWYVNKSVSSSGNGLSWATAWKNFSNINWTSVQPGDFIYISGGSDSLIYYEELVVNKSGTKANRITIIAGKYSPNPSGHSGRVIIDGGGTRDRSIYIHDRKYITIKGFECRYGQKGVSVEGDVWVSNIILDSLNIYNYYDQAGIMLNGIQSTYTIDSTIIRNCRIVSFNMYPGQTDGLYMQGAQRTVIHNNFIHIPNQDPLAHNDAVQGYHCNGFVIYNNVMINDSVNSPEGGGIPLILGSEGSNPVIIYNNFIYMGGVWLPNGNMGAGLCLRWYDTNSMPPTYVLNNTIVINGPRARGFWWQYGANIAVNNIVAMYCPPAYRSLTWMDNLDVGDYNSVTGQSANVNNIRQNLFWKMNVDIGFGGQYTGNGNTGGISGWNSWVNTYGGTGVHADPLFVNNFGYEPDQGALDGELQSNSPAINQGEDIQTLIESFGLSWTDINGNPRDNTPTIGAYEYDAGPDLTSPRVTSATLSDSITLVVNFSEALDQATAENKNNYSITNNISVLNASLSGTKVILQTSPHSSGSYVVTVVNVKDLAGNLVDPAHNTDDYEYIVLPPDTLMMFPIVGVDGIIQEPNHTPEKTIDGQGALSGDPDSRWAAEPMPEELTFDLGAVRTVCKTKLSFFNWNAGRVYNYSILISNDNNNWVTIVPQTASVLNEEWTIDEFPAVQARYVKIHFISNNQSTWAGLWEAEIWGINVVPVELISFNAECNDGRVNLEWITATELNNLGFEIQRKHENSEWESIAFIEGHGTTTEQKEYSYIDDISLVQSSVLVYRLKQIDFDGSFEYSEVVELETIPSKFELSQNYPNPFNPSTTIRFSLPEATQLKINVYNILGELVETIAEGTYKAGTYKVNFEANELSSGAYIYRIESETFVQVKKMILLQ